MSMTDFTSGKNRLELVGLGLDDGRLHREVFMRYKSKVDLARLVVSLAGFALSVYREFFKH